MPNTRMILEARCKQARGKLCKWWGRLVGSQSREFMGDLIIVEGKLQEYYAGSIALGAHRRTNSRLFRERRCAFHIVA